MLGRTVTRHATGRLAKRVPALKFLVLGDLAMLARRHLNQLTPEERRRFGTLVGQAARRRPLSAAERDELSKLASKLDGRALAGGVADAFSPVPLPRRLREGRRRR
jgi:hypothetical protein